MKISITYIDGSQENFTNIDSTNDGDNFLELLDEDESITVGIPYNQIRKVEYD